MNYHVIASGSGGNAVVYHDSIMVDCGIPFSLVKPHLYNLRIILLTHEHKDHINIATLKKLSDLRPTLIVAGCDWMIKHTLSVKNFYTFEIGKQYKFNEFTISPIKLYHDVPNCGYRIINNSSKIFHATDTAHLNGISAKDYDLYAIEHNYDEEEIVNRISENNKQGKFSYEKGAMNSHLSFQQANDFIFKNGGENYEVVRLHEHSSI